MRPAKPNNPEKLDMNLKCELEPYYEAIMVVVSGTTEIRRKIKIPASSPEQARELMESTLRVFWPDSVITITEPIEVKS